MSSRSRSIAFLDQRLGRRRFLRAQLGAELGLQWNITTAHRSQLTIGTDLSVGWRFLELAYAPALQIGLGRQEREVFGGRAQRGLSRGAIAHTFALRTRWDL